MQDEKILQNKKFSDLYTEAENEKWFSKSLQKLSADEYRLGSVDSSRLAKALALSDDNILNNPKWITTIAYYAMFYKALQFLRLKGYDFNSNRVHKAVLACLGYELICSSNNSSYFELLIKYEDFQNHAILLTDSYQQALISRRSSSYDLTKEISKESIDDTIKNMNSFLKEMDIIINLLR